MADTAQQEILRDQDILQNLLKETKTAASLLNQYILDASNDELRRDYMVVLGEVYARQKQVSDLMQEKGYYNPKPAREQDMAALQSKFSPDRKEPGQSEQMQ